MKILLLYDYPPSPSGLATQGDLLYKGLLEMGVEAHAVHWESVQEKEWYYRWFKPDVVVGVGYWGYTPQLILHPQQFGALAVPWLVADGFIARHQDVLNDLPLILVTSQWVKEMYMRDGINGDNIEVLPVGCDTHAFRHYAKNDPKVRAVRKHLGVADDKLLILTIGGDAASKGAQEVMQALALIDKQVPDWHYVCKVWPQPRTDVQTLADMELARQLGIDKKITYANHVISRNFIPYLLNACDIYAGPSRLEGFGMLQVEAGACEKPVVGIRAMGMLDTLIHEETALLAGVAQQIVVNEVMLGDSYGVEENRKVVFDSPRTVDYRASIPDIAEHLLRLMNDPELRLQLGKNGRKRVVEHFDYRKVAHKFVTLIQQKLGIN
jgi:starch synthase